MKHSIWNRFRKAVLGGQRAHGADSLRDPGENYRMAMEGYVLDFYNHTTR